MKIFSILLAFLILNANALNASYLSLDIRSVLSGSLSVKELLSKTISINLKNSHTFGSIRCKSNDVPIEFEFFCDGLNDLNNPNVDEIFTPSLNFTIIDNLKNCYCFKQINESSFDDFYSCKCYDDLFALNEVTADELKKIKQEYNRFSFFEKVKTQFEFIIWLAKQNKKRILEFNYDYANYEIVELNGAPKKMLDNSDQLLFVRDNQSRNQTVYYNCESYKKLEWICNQTKYL